MKRWAVAAAVAVVAAACAAEVAERGWAAAEACRAAAAATAGPVRHTAVVHGRRMVEAEAIVLQALQSIAAHR